MSELQRAKMKNGEPVPRVHASCLPGSMQLWRVADIASLSDSYVPATLSLVFPVWYGWLSFQLEGSDAGRATPWHWRAFSCSREHRALQGVQIKCISKPNIFNFARNFNIWENTAKVHQCFKSIPLSQCSSSLWRQLQWALPS